MITVSDSNVVRKADSNSIDEIRKIFPTGEADKHNWFIASTSGVHGTYTTLAEIVADFYLPDDDNDKNSKLSYLILQPRILKIIYGEVTIIDLSDVVYLRRLIASTLVEIEASQDGNSIISSVDKIK